MTATTFRIYTITPGEVTAGATVERFQLSNGISIPAIVVGQKGRGRYTGVLPVHLPGDVYARWMNNEEIVVNAGQIGKTASGKPKLIATNAEPFNPDKYIGVFRTPIGFRGWNGHFHFEDGDQIYDDNEDLTARTEYQFDEILTIGQIAQGDAGRMGSGQQYIAVCDINNRMLIHVGGRTYGRPKDFVVYRNESGEPAVLAYEEYNLIV